MCVCCFACFLSGSIASIMSTENYGNYSNTKKPSQFNVGQLDTIVFVCKRDSDYCICFLFSIRACGLWTYTPVNLEMGFECRWNNGNGGKVKTITAKQKYPSNACDCQHLVFHAPHTYTHTHIDINTDTDKLSKIHKYISFHHRVELIFVALPLTQNAQDFLFDSVFCVRQSKHSEASASEPHTSGATSLAWFSDRG